MDCLYTPYIQTAKFIRTFRCPNFAAKAEGEQPSSEIEFAPLYRTINKNLELLNCGVQLHAVLDKQK